MATRVDRKIETLSEKISRLQEQMSALEAEKKAQQITADHESIKTILELIQDTAMEIKAPAAKIIDVIASTRVKRAKKSGQASVEPKYRDPANYDNTWTGRGIAPLWLQRYEAIGRNRDEFLIRK